MMSAKNFLQWPFFLKSACILISILALGYLAHIGQTILVPFILGTLFALLLVPICNWFERKLKFPRTLAAIVVVLLFFGAVGTICYILGSQLTLLKEDWPAFEQQLLSMFQSLQNWVDVRFGINTDEQMKYINSTAASSMNAGTAVVGVVLMSFSSLFVLLVFTFLYTFFMLIYRRHIVRFFLLINMENDHPVVMDIISQVQYVVKKYLVGLLIQMAIVSGLVYIALLIIGVKYSLLLAVISGVFNVLPYIGIFASMLVVAIVTFATASPTHVLFVILAYIVIHAIDGNFVVPKIVGSKVKINSLFAMMAIIVGEMIWGISGMFLAIPVLAICKIIFDRIRDLKPWGYLLGEEHNDTQAFGKVLAKQAKMKFEGEEVDTDRTEDE